MVCFQSNDIERFMQFLFILCGLFSTSLAVVSIFFVKFVIMYFVQIVFKNHYLLMMPQMVCFHSFMQVESSVLFKFVFFFISYPGSDSCILSIQRTAQFLPFIQSRCSFGGLKRELLYSSFFMPLAVDVQ